MTPSDHDEYGPAFYETPIDMIVKKQIQEERNKQLDAYGIALMMIREGAESPKQIAADVLARFEAGR